MGFLDFFQRRARIRGPAQLADFIDRNAAFVAQKGIFEYSRARAGNFSKFLFAEKEFLDLLERARWLAFPIGLAMTGEVAEGILRPPFQERGTAAIELVKATVLEVFDRYPVPAIIAPEQWSEARLDLARNMDQVALHPPKPAKDIPERFADAYIGLMPIHEKLRQHEGPTIRNYLRVQLCNIHEELTRQLDSATLAASLRYAA